MLKELCHKLVGFGNRRDRSVFAGLGLDFNACGLEPFQKRYIATNCCFVSLGKFTQTMLLRTQMPKVSFQQRYVAMESRLDTTTEHRVHDSVFLFRKAFI